MSWMFITHSGHLNALLGSPAIAKVPSLFGPLGMSNLGGVLGWLAAFARALRLPLILPKMLDEVCNALGFL
jgi:hypothetical protein